MSVLVAFFLLLVSIVCQISLFSTVFATLIFSCSKLNSPKSSKIVPVSDDKLTTQTRAPTDTTVFTGTACTATTNPELAKTQNNTMLMTAKLDAEMEAAKRSAKTKEEKTDLAVEKSNGKDKDGGKDKKKDTDTTLPIESHFIAAPGPTNLKVSRHIPAK